MIVSTRRLHLKKPSEIKTLYFTVSLVSFSEGLISIFVPIFLFQSGYAINQIILFYILGATYYVLLAIGIKKYISIFSDKLFLTISLPFLFFYYILISQIPDNPWLFWIVPALGATFGLLFYIGYHLDFCNSSEDKHSGSNVGKEYAILSLVSLASPFIGGVIIKTTGFNNVFYIAAVTVFLAVIPTWFYPKKRISTTQSIKYSKYWFSKELLPINLSSIGYSIESSISRIIWPIFIIGFIKGVEILGLYTSLALFAGAFISIIVGKIADKNRGKKIVTSGTISNSIIWISRTIISAPYLLLISQPIKELFYQSVMIPLTTTHYKIAHRKSNPGAFIMANELLYNVARMLILPIVMLLSIWLSPDNFYTVAFILAAIFGTGLIFVNKQKI